MKDAIAERKKKTKKLSLLNTPLRSINAYLANKRADKKETEDINKMVMQVDNFKLDGETRERKKYIRGLIAKCIVKRLKEWLHLKKKTEHKGELLCRWVKVHMVRLKADHLQRI